MVRSWLSRVALVGLLHARAEPSSAPRRTRIVVVGSGVAGTEVGTFLANATTTALEIIEIEADPERRFGGWAFQSFPSSESTNLAMRKMYLGRDPTDIHTWAGSPAHHRANWPPKFRNFTFDRDTPLPRALMQHYLRWRRSTTRRELATFTSVTGEAVGVRVTSQGCPIEVELSDGRTVTGDHLVLASGSTAVKVPPFLQHLGGHPGVILDPLVPEGHRRRGEIPIGSRVLIVGTGLTGEEQVSVLLNAGHSNLTLLSRSGKRHFAYPAKQTNKPLSIATPPDFLQAETPEEFNFRLSSFFQGYLTAGHSPEDVFAAIRPHWNQMRANVGGCYKAAERLFNFRRTLATESIGASWEVSGKARAAEARGALEVVRGHIATVDPDGDALRVSFVPSDAVARAPGNVTHTREFDYVINAVGRNIIQHALWQQLLRDGLSRKHAGIGVRVTEEGRLLDAQGEPSNRIWVVGMARAGDHALRHGFLGNTAFNVPMVRSHLYDTMDSLLATVRISDAQSHIPNIHADDL
eukprot:m.17800 g.17800  ORF g.17800 m.17800 type:complete len:523 (-) comp5225_c0_seq1:1201-2769(-)